MGSNSRHSSSQCVLAWNSDLLRISDGSLWAAMLVEPSDSRSRDISASSNPAFDYIVTVHKGDRKPGHFQKLCNDERLTLFLETRPMAPAPLTFFGRGNGYFVGLSVVPEGIQIDLILPSDSLVAGKLLLCPIHRVAALSRSRNEVISRIWILREAGCLFCHYVLHNREVLQLVPAYTEGARDLVRLLCRYQRFGPGQVGANHRS